MSQFLIAAPRSAPSVARPVCSSCLRIRQRRRAYHSEAYPDPPPFSRAESAILSASLHHVPRNGFTTTALTLGAKDAGYLDVSVQLFPKGPFDLINYYLVIRRLDLKDRIHFPEESRLSLSAKVRALVWARLQSNKDIIHQWQGALATMALPANVPPSFRELSLLSSEIWYLAGDTSVDGSWYTKRASLAAIYSASEVFMTTDKSPDFRATEEFLDRRLEDVNEVGKIVGGLGKYVGFWAGSAVSWGRSMGMRV